MKSRTFENSMLYQKEIITFLGDISTLKGSYESLENSINSIKNKYQEDNYKNTFEFINSANNKLGKLIDKLNTVDSNIKLGSQETYTELEQKFISTYTQAKNELDSAKSAIDNYNNVVNSLRNINTFEGEEYNTLLSQRDSYEDSSNSSLSTVRSYITTLNDYLEKGVKKS